MINQSTWLEILSDGTDRRDSQAFNLGEESKAAWLLTGRWGFRLYSVPSGFTMLRSTFSINPLCLKPLSHHDFDTFAFLH